MYAMDRLAHHIAHTHLSGTKLINEDNVLKSRGMKQLVRGWELSKTVFTVTLGTLGNYTVVTQCCSDTTTLLL